MSRPERHVYEFGPFRLDPAERLLVRDGQVMPLTPKALETLVALVQNAGRVLDKHELMHWVWPDAFVEEGNLAQQVFLLRKALGEGSTEPQFIETVPRRGYRFVARVEKRTDETAGPAAPDHRHVGAGPPRATKPDTALAAGERIRLTPVGGALATDSEFYIVRPADEELRSAIVRRDSIILVKGPRQVGKTSLLACGLQQAREAGARIVLTDLQDLNAPYLATIEKLFLVLAELIADQLDLRTSPDHIWNPQLSPSINFHRYLRQEVLARISAPIVWALDEVDRLFHCDFGSEVFALFRSWHNKRALDPSGAWQRLTVAIAYATEAGLFISDLNQSPFNVGTRLLLEDFDLQQVAELNRRYGSPLHGEEVARYFRLVCGHPYLVQCGLHAMASRGIDLKSLEAGADRDEGVFGDHLRRVLLLVTRDSAILDVVRALLRGERNAKVETFHRLRSGGVLAGNAVDEMRFRCHLYDAYLRRHLL